MVCVCVCLEGVGHCLLGAQEKKHIAKHGFFFQFCDLKNSANISNKKKSNISWIHTKKKPKISNLLVEKKIVDPKRKKDKQIQWLQHKS